MTDRVFYKSFLIMTVTVALQNLIVYGVNLADSVMLGAYSETALSGTGVCNNLQFLLLMGVTGVANGMTVIASRSWGATAIHRTFPVLSCTTLIRPSTMCCRPMRIASLRR